MLKTIKDSGIQRSMFDGTIPLKLKKPIRLIELFAGIGAQAKALENLGIEFEHYRICEFDKYAVASYNAVHGTNFQTSDITKIHAEDLGIIDTDKYDYVMTYSFPCTDLSKAGKQLGMSRESGTRSGLLWEVERLLKETKELPQILLMENVPDILSEKNRNDFYSWCDFLEKLGYTSKYAILNAKDYGIPQNRERCFMISWLGEEYYYDFPGKITLPIRFKDVLEKKVDKKYYLSEKTIKYFIKHTQESIEKGNGFRFEPTDGNVIAKTITTRAGSRMDDNFIKEKYRFYEQAIETVEKNECENGDTIDAFSGADLKRNGIGIINNAKIRKLTPKECWRLMGFDDESFSRAEKVVSNSQLYKQAGNSIVVNVLMEIFRKLF